MYLSSRELYKCLALMLFWKECENVSHRDMKVTNILFQGQNPLRMCSGLGIGCHSINFWTPNEELWIINFSREIWPEVLHPALGVHPGDGGTDDRLPKYFVTSAPTSIPFL